MSESLRNDGRVWVPKKAGDKRHPNEIPEDERDYYLERRYPTFGNLVPRDVASRNAKMVCDEGRGVGETGRAVYLDFRDAINEKGIDYIKDKYGNLFEMYERITGENPYEVPMKIYPAVHYTMGGLWVDYNLMSTIPGLFVLGEANFSDHGANRLGASALMQGLADGYFVIPYTMGDYLATAKPEKVDTKTREFEEVEKDVKESIEKLMSVKGKTPAREFHRKLRDILWNKVGLSRNKEGLEQAVEEIRALREEFWKDVKIPGKADDLNKTLEYTGRVADYMELAELIAIDALHREESCGAHFREEYQTEDGEALRDDKNFSYVAAWEYGGENESPVLHKEKLEFEYVKPTQRSYK
jgi:succinate dehydrogenase / fumarate reductase flavoprotein subunit